MLAIPFFGEFPDLTHGTHGTHVAFALAVFRTLFIATFADALINASLLDAEMLGLLFDEEHPMGFMVTSAPLGDDEVDVITYKGELAGTTTMLTLLPKQGGVVVILSNNNAPYSSLLEFTLAFAQHAFGR